jgi:hypothetical protein
VVHPCCDFASLRAGGNPSGQAAEKAVGSQGKARILVNGGSRSEELFWFSYCQCTNGHWLFLGLQRKRHGLPIPPLG